MPLSEFYKMARGSLESAQQRTTTTSSADLSHLPGNELVELVWDNGQIVMQGQSTRARKTSSSIDFQSQTLKVRDKNRLNATHSKMGKFGVMDCVLNDFASAVPSGEMGLDQDDDMVPWLNYPLDESIPHDYCSDILPELSGVTVNQISSHSSFATNKRGSYNRTTRGSNYVQNGLGLEHENAAKVSSSEVGEGSGPRISHFFPWSFQENQTSIPSHKSGVSSIISNNITNTKHAVCGHPSNGVKIQKQDSVLPNTNSGIMNFSHFSRPAALVHTNLQNVSAITSPVTLGIEGMGGKNKGPSLSSTNFAESTLINLSSGLSKGMDANSQPNSVPPKVDSVVVGKPINELRAAEQSEAVCQEDVVKNDKLLGQVVGEKNVEPVVAPSSLCSGNSAERASNDLTHDLKRKCQETDDSEGRSEDIEEESVGIRKAAPVRRGTGSKRSRAAEVHNLSERRRRDRINEKMRALQELIPNCNKVDKASMLDEAIEYLKTLQLQVQMMSMGGGMYMPPMMFPAGMAQLHAAHMARFSPMGVGFGMGMMDMNGGSPGCPMMQVPPLHGAPFRAPHPAPIFAPTSFQGMAGPNFQVFGHPAPRVPFSGVPPINSAMELNATRMAAPVELPNSAPSSNPKDLIQNANSQMMHNANASTSMNHTSTQVVNEMDAEPCQQRSGTLLRSIAFEPVFCCAAIRVMVPCLTEFGSVRKRVKEFSE
ncbi:hypothetical protein RHMOL_Rhmol11G0166700 [Rhododendron molle]|uniref:Uncharacterized protein n=1 Tax=Rhododendron molle TaxID=49168 RepID=A0ACC0LUJ9_RHOML|nr:hypothetical protein RHMOL_Rhmol11G0166700 [Rhododendron molle]